MPKINCNITRTFTKEFFNNSLTISIRDMIYAHLLDCPACAKVYVEYAKGIGKKDYNIIEDALKFVSSNIDKHPNSIKYTVEQLEKLNLKENIQKMKENKWEKAADEMDMEKLMQLRCFRDFAQTKIEYTPDEEVAYYKYGRYIAKQMAQRVDLLERCYNLKGDKE